MALQGIGSEEEPIVLAFSSPISTTPECFARTESDPVAPLSPPAPPNSIAALADNGDGTDDRWMHAPLTPGVFGAALRHGRWGSVQTQADDVPIKPLMDRLLNNVGLARLDSGSTPAAEALFQQKDAFGSVLATSGTPGGARAGLKELGSFAWRGREWTKSFGFMAGANSADAGAASENATDLYRMGDRAYDGTSGRFMQADREILAGASPLAANRYLYAIGDPANITDETGCDFTYISLTFATKESVEMRMSDFNVKKAAGQKITKEVMQRVARNGRWVKDTDPFFGGSEGMLFGDIYMPIDWADKVIRSAYHISRTACRVGRYVPTAPPW